METTFLLSDMSENQSDSDLCIINLVERTSYCYPDNLALICEDGGATISYRELLNRSKELRDFVDIVIGDESVKFVGVNGAPPNSMVSIMTHRGIGMIVSILGVLLAGAAYVPIDPSFPPDRQLHIFTHSRSRILIVDEDNYKAFQEMNIDLANILVINSSTGAIIDKSLCNISEDNKRNIKNKPKPDDLAYGS